MLRMSKRALKKEMREGVQVGVLDVRPETEITTLQVNDPRLGSPDYTGASRTGSDENGSGGPPGQECWRCSSPFQITEDGSSAEILPLKLGISAHQAGREI
ncbi:hypothetical protein CAEBREN_13668 [Caenorhabditis brenneri]|uniref:Uncharacterized protein n=1 Tax=Caenorhabditis brenneri TaxID=135651 RepID=G0N2Y6_CAEBE|nr:hypothetical protein CAEBREN_13668 [Caenorhabditis brenneri]